MFFIIAADTLQIGKREKCPGWDLSENTMNQIPSWETWGLEANCTQNHEMILL